MFSKKMLRFAVSLLGVVFAVSIFIGLFGGIAMAACPDDDEFTSEFRLQDCRYFKTIGKNPYFKLIPGYKLVLEGKEDEDTIRAEVKVLWETENINLPGVGWIRTRVVVEREEVNGVLVEVSRNFFAICKKTNSVLYFGEDVEVCDLEETGGFADNEEQCNNGSEPENPGEWRVGENGAMPGIIMPGTFLLGSKYFQEIAEEAMDRGENTAMGLTWPLEEDLEDGEEPIFSDCVEVVDTNPLGEPPVCEEEEGDAKIYCPGVGLVQDEELKLVEHGYERYPPWCRYR